LAFGALLGSNFTVTGSLAGMPCLASARRAGVAIMNGDAMQAGFVVTPPLLVIDVTFIWRSPNR
jgi:Na+/H+ antiporter NhaD/arsenite permease-like protein